MKLYHKTSHPIVGNYIVKMLKKVRHYRFWKIIKPIIVNKNLNFWRIRFNYLPIKFIDEKEKIVYLPNYYDRSDILYTFKLLDDNIQNYIDIHLYRIKKIITTKYNFLFEKYKERIDKKYESEGDKILNRFKSEDTLLLTSICKTPNLSKVVLKNIWKKSCIGIY